MNKKASFIAIFIILIVLIAAGYGIYYIWSPNPNNYSPTGSFISTPSSNPNPYDSSNNPSGSNPITYSSASDSSSCGDYGSRCCLGDVCYYGECQNGVCVHCGSFGETCCYREVDSLQCFKGASCVLGRCKVDPEYYNDCGMIGYAPCDYTGCYYGNYNSYSGICEACGDYEQPCCPNTDYPCTYGQCINGICKKVSTSSSAQNPSPQDYPIEEYQESTTISSSQASSLEQTNCGHLDQPCCQDANRLSPTGIYSSTQPLCYDYLDCIANVCVNGPEFEAYNPVTQGYD